VRPFLLHNVIGRTGFLACIVLLIAGVPGSPRAGAQPLAADRPQIKGPLSLQLAVQTGLRENLMVRAAQADVRAAQADTRATRAMTLPQVSANTYLSTGSMSNILGTSPNVTPVNNLNVPSKPFADQNLTLMIPLYTGGRLGSLVRAAAQRERAASADVGGVQAGTALMVKDAYYRALLAVELVKVAQARVDADAELVRNARALFEAGKGIEAAVLRAEAELADAQRELTSARNDQAKALLDLKTAMGVRPDSDITLSDTLAFVPPPGDVNASLGEAARTRPELLAARARVEAAKAGVSAAKGSLAPQVYGTAMADAFGSKEMNSGSGYTVGAAISFPLFDAGQRRAEVAGARAMQERAEAEARDTELRVSNEVRQAWLDVQTAQQNYKTAQSALQAAQSAYDVTALRVQNQKGIQVELLDAIAALTRARANLAQALYDHSIAVARLQRAIGKP
jgi:outer membrane protein